MKENKKEDSIYHKKEDNKINGNNNFPESFKETLIRILINKIISNVIYEIERKLLEHKVKKYCYNFTKNHIDNLIETNFFSILLC